MGDVVLTKTRLHAGVWEGVLTGIVDKAPVLTLRLNGDIVPGLDITPADAGTYLVRAPIAADLIGDDLHTFTIVREDTTDILASFVVFAGEQLDDDLRAQVDLLRAELDLLKRAFRKHCVDTA